MNVLLCINGYKKIYVYYFNINKQIDVNKKNQCQESCVLFFPRHNQYQRFWSWYHQDKNKIIEEYLYILPQVCYVTDIVKQMNIVKKINIKYLVYFFSNNTISKIFILIKISEKIIQEYSYILHQVCCVTPMYVKPVYLIKIRQMGTWKTLMDINI